MFNVNIYTWTYSYQHLYRPLHIGTQINIHENIPWKILIQKRTQHGNFTEIKLAFFCVSYMAFVCGFVTIVYIRWIDDMLWWRHQMETFSALLAICARNSPVTGEFPTQRPVMWSFDVFFDLRLNKRLSKQWWGWWFETPTRPLWRHYNTLFHSLVSLMRATTALILVPIPYHFPVTFSPFAQKLWWYLVVLWWSDL